VCAFKDAHSIGIVDYSIDSGMKPRLVATALNNAGANRGDVARSVHTDRESCSSEAVSSTMLSTVAIRSAQWVGSVPPGHNDAKEAFLTLAHRNVLDRRTSPPETNSRSRSSLWIEKSCYCCGRQVAFG
jgi:hypothetical protein